MTLTDELIAAGLATAPVNHGAGQAPAAVVRPPDHAPGFVEPGWFPVLRYALLESPERGATLFGPRGSGKSTAIRELARQSGHCAITMQCAKGMQLDAFIGTWTVQAGATAFVEGPLTQAVRMGHWLLAEEANAIDPGIWSNVNTLTDRTGEGLRLPTGEVVPNHPNFRLVLLYNEGYVGTRDVNPAMKDRLMPVLCTYPDAAHESMILQALTGATAADCDRVVDLARLIRAANLRFDLSPRALARWIGLALTAKLGWTEGFTRAVVDLVGGPEMAAPQRAALEELAKQANVGSW